MASSWRDAANGQFWRDIVKRHAASKLPVRAFLRARVAQIRAGGPAQQERRDSLGRESQRDWVTQRFEQLGYCGGTVPVREPGPAGVSARG